MVFAVGFFKDGPKTFAEMGSGGGEITADILKMGEK